MTDDLTPQQTDAVRRALRAACHDAPLPEDVGTRLDATLAGLVADRAAGTAAAPVVPLRRRRWPAYLAAAAAVTAISLAGSQLVDRGGDSAGFSTADEAESAPSALSTTSDPDGAAADGFSDNKALDQLNGPLPLTPAQRAALADQGYHRLRLAPLAAAALAGEGRSSMKSISPSTASAPLPQDNLAARIPLCLPADLDLPAGVVPAYYLARHAGEPVVLVVLPGPEVSAYSCGGGEPTPVPLD